jgi:hypothetical protein
LPLEEMNESEDNSDWITIRRVITTGFTRIQGTLRPSPVSQSVMLSELPLNQELVNHNLAYKGSVTEFSVWA